MRELNEIDANENDIKMREAYMKVFWRENPQKKEKILRRWEEIESQWKNGLQKRFWFLMIFSPVTSGMMEFFSSSIFIFSFEWRRHGITVISKGFYMSKSHSHVSHWILGKALINFKFWQREIHFRFVWRVFSCENKETDNNFCYLWIVDPEKA